MKNKGNSYSKPITFQSFYACVLEAIYDCRIRVGGTL